MQSAILSKIRQEAGAVLQAIMVLLPLILASAVVDAHGPARGGGHRGGHRIGRPSSGHMQQMQRQAIMDAYHGAEKEWAEMDKEIEELEKELHKPQKARTKPKKKFRTQAPAKKKKTDKSDDEIEWVKIKPPKDLTPTPRTAIGKPGNANEGLPSEDTSGPRTGGATKPGVAGAPGYQRFPSPLTGGWKPSGSRGIPPQWVNVPSQPGWPPGGIQPPPAIGPITTPGAPDWSDGLPTDDGPDASNSASNPSQGAGGASGGAQPSSAPPKSRWKPHPVWQIRFVSTGSGSIGPLGGSGVVIEMRPAAPVLDQHDRVIGWVHAEEKGPPVKIVFVGGGGSVGSPVSWSGGSDWQVVQTGGKVIPHDFVGGGAITSLPSISVPILGGIGKGSVMTFPGVKFVGDDATGKNGEGVHFNPPAKTLGGLTDAGVSVGGVSFGTWSFY